MRTSLSTSLALAAALTAGCVSESPNTQALSPQLAEIEVGLKGTQMRVDRALSGGQNSRQDSEVHDDGKYVCTVHGISSTEAEEGNPKTIVLHDDTHIKDGLINPRLEYFERYSNAAAAAAALKDGSYVDHRNKFKALDNK